VKAFTFVRPASFDEASKEAMVKGAVVKAAGIDLLDRMKERIDVPERVVWLGDVKDAGLTKIEFSDASKSTLVVGSMVTLASLASSEKVRSACPALADAAGLAASPQLRARATLAGNLLQHTRCGYYRHASFPCFKRGDATCPVLEDGAIQDTAAIFGNRQCASAHPSSLAPILCALDAKVAVTGEGPKSKGSPWIAVRELYRPPERGVRSDAVLAPAALVTEVGVPAGRRSAYEEVRQKAAFDWALVSCCVASSPDGSSFSIWLGAVAPTPWRAEAAEKALAGKQLTDETIRAAADAAVVGATPLPGSAYKVDLVKVIVRRALERLRSAK
jgi:xanthine dehydrogenase YagS FAD-binding subunit